MAVYHADEPDPETVKNEGIVHIRIHIHAFEHPDGNLHLLHSSGFLICAYLTCLIPSRGMMKVTEYCIHLRRIKYALHTIIQTRQDRLS